MPRVYRTMKAEDKLAKPVVGDAADKLGIRIRDIAPDQHGNAQPAKGGLSVMRSMATFRTRIAMRLFPPTMLPQRLHDLGKIPGALGSNALRVYRIGEGPFERGTLNEKLAVEPDSDDHATIQPVSVMPYHEYKQAIYDTRDQWQNGEADDDS